MIYVTFVQDHKVMHHAKYLGSRHCSFRETRLCKLSNPQGGDIFDPSCIIFHTTVEDASLKISDLWALYFQKCFRPFKNCIVGNCLVNFISPLFPFFKDTQIKQGIIIVLQAIHKSPTG
jgi:hypothetical protein